MTVESGDRATFLSGFAGARWSSHRDPQDAAEDDVEVGYTGVPDFAGALDALGGVARTLRDGDDVVTFVNAAVDNAKGTRAHVRVVLTDEPECAAVAFALGGRADVIAVDYTDAAAVATADIGFTGARAGVARTGSIVVDARHAGGRTVSLLPPMHVALVQASAIVAEPGDMWRSLGEPMPSNLVQITGPSRSADIELIITLGVHGPRELWVGVVDSGM